MRLSAWEYVGAQQQAALEGGGAQQCCRTRSRRVRRVQVQRLLICSCDTSFEVFDDSAVVARRRDDGVPPSSN